MKGGFDSFAPQPLARSRWKSLRLSHISHRPYWDIYSWSKGSTLDQEKTGPKHGEWHSCQNREITQELWESESTSLVVRVHVAELPAGIDEPILPIRLWNGWE